MILYTNAGLTIGGGGGQRSAAAQIRAYLFCLRPRYTTTAFRLKSSIVKARIFVYHDSHGIPVCESVCDDFLCRRLLTGCLGISHLSLGIISCEFLLSLRHCLGDFLCSYRDNHSMSASFGSHATQSSYLLMLHDMGLKDSQVNEDYLNTQKTGRTVICCLVFVLVCVSRLLACAGAAVREARCHTVARIIDPCSGWASPCSRLRSFTLCGRCGSLRKHINLLMCCGSERHLHGGLRIPSAGLTPECNPWIGCS